MSRHMNVEGVKTFDSRVHFKDSKGQLTKAKPYRRFYRGQCEYNWDAENGLMHANGEVVTDPGPIPADLRSLIKAHLRAAKPAPAAPVAPAPRGRGAKAVPVQAAPVAPAPPADTDPNPEPQLGDAPLAHASGL